MSQLAKIREQQPLVHNMTNQVVANQVANGLLALGASPIMAYEKAEMEDIVSLASCLVLNIGTITETTFESMLVAGKVANHKNIPVVLDPVGVGASQYRRDVVKRLLEEVKMTLIRGNAGELAALGNVPWEAKGVDSGEGEYPLQDLAVTVAREFQTIVAISGEIDWISDGTTTYRVMGGSPLMTKVTGMGCLLSAVCGAFIGVTPQNSERLLAVVEAHAWYSQVGSIAAQSVSLPGSFVREFVDLLAIYDSKNLSDYYQQIEVEDLK